MLENTISSTIYMIMYYYTCATIINGKNCCEKKKVVYSISVIHVDNESIGSSCSFSSKTVNKGPKS